MRCITKRIEFTSRSDCIRIIPIGDIHLGNKHCDEKLLKETIKEIEEDDKTFWVHMGDGCDYINRRDPRFDPDELPGWLMGDLRDLAKAERVREIELLKPIGHKCLGMIEGNHEHMILVHSERDVYTTVAEGIGASDVCLGPSGFIRLKLVRMSSGKRGGTWTVVIFATHGFWGGKLMGAGALNLERIAGWTEADMVLAGHDHKRRADPVDKFVTTAAGKVETKTVHCVSCGTFLGQADYAERKGYRPSSVGPVEILIWPDKKLIKTLV